MLKVGQQRSNRKKTALAAEPCCASDSKSLMEFQGHTTTPQGWPELNANPNAMNTCDLCTVRAQSTSTVSPNMGASGHWLVGSTHPRGGALFLPVDITFSSVISFLSN